MSQSVAMLAAAVPPPRVEPTSPAPTSLEDLISPLSREEFFAQYWEKNFLHVPSRRSFEDLFSLSDIDRWLKAPTANDPEALLMTPPSPMKTKQDNITVRSDEIEVKTVYEKLAAGWSVVLNHLEGSWLPLRGLVEALGAQFSCDIGVNVYLTPQGSQTFNVHTDNHDVFILQVSGQKRWRLHELTELTPINLHYRDHLNFPPFWSRPGEAPLIADLTLEAGEVLFIPRGMPHCAVAEDETSLHLTVSVNPTCWVDFFRAAIEQSCFEIDALRRALPPNFVEYDSDALETLTREFQAIRKKLADDLNFEDTLTAMRRGRIHQHGFPRDGHLSEIAELDSLNQDSWLERRPNMLVMVERFEKYGNASIRFGREHIRGPIGLADAFDLVSRKEHFQVKELPRMDAASQLVLVRRLVKGGLLRRISGPIR